MSLDVVVLLVGVALALVLLGLGGWLAWSLLRFAQQPWPPGKVRAWLQAGERAGLSAAGDGLLGRVNGAEVRLRTEVAGGREVVEARVEGLPRDIWCRERSPSPGVGDAALDAALPLGGNRSRWVASLDLELRGFLVRQVRAMHLEDGVLVLTLRDTSPAATGEQVALIGRLVWALSQEVRAERLMAVAEQDPVRSVRLAAVAQLDHEDHHRALHRLVAEAGDPWVQAAAARELWDPDALLDLLGHVEEVALGAELLGALETSYAKAAMAAVFDNPALTPLAMSRLLRHGAHVEPAALVRLAERLMHSKDAALARRLAHTIGVTGQVRLQSAALVLLAHEEREVWRAAVGALGEVGTAEAVAPLQAAAPALPVGADAQAVRRALQKIQARLAASGVEAGGVMLVEEVEAGGLSLARGASRQEEEAG